MLCHACLKQFSIVHRAVTLEVHGAEKLAKADKGVGNSSDPFVTVFWNNKRVGQTGVIEDNCDPVWHGERFVLALPPKVHNANLRLEVADQDKRGFGDFLGQVEFLGAGMKDAKLNEMLMKAFPEGKGLTLHKKPRINQKKQKVKGEIKISFEIHPTPCVPVCLQIIAAMNLAKADKGKGGKSDPYCLIYWNGKKLGQSSVIENTHDPQWGNETFLIPVPEVALADDAAAVAAAVEAGDGDAATAAAEGGVSGAARAALAAAELVIEVRDFDTGGVKGDFLGQIVLRGGQLEVSALPTGKTEFELQAKKYDEKTMSTAEKAGMENMSLVKGSLFVKFSTMGSNKLQAKDVGKLRGWSKRAKKRVLMEKELVLDTEQMMMDVASMSDGEKRVKALQYGLGALSVFVWDPATDEADAHMNTKEGS